MRAFGHRLPRLPAGSRLARRLREERGVALVMALGILTVLAVSATSVVYFTSSQSRSTAQNENRADAYSLAEAGMNAALAVLGNALNAKTATALPACSSPTAMSLEGGSTSYCGVLNTSTYVWTLTSTGTAPSPTGGAPLTHTLHRTVTVKGISDGATVSAWSRFYQDSPTGCLTIDTVSIPGLRRRAELPPAPERRPDHRQREHSRSRRRRDHRRIGRVVEHTRRSDGDGMDEPSNIVSSNNVYATASVAASGTSANLDATNFGFSIPSGNTIVGIQANVERKAATASSPVTLDSTASAATGSSGVSYDTASSATSATAGDDACRGRTRSGTSRTACSSSVSPPSTASTSCQASDRHRAAASR